MKKRQSFSFFTTVITFLALMIGNLVVATGAGDACGTDWPKCNGAFIPDVSNPLTVIEYSHRLFTGMLGFIILGNFILALRQKQVGEKAVGRFAYLSLFFLFLQSLVGGLNVLLGTPVGFTTIDVMVSLFLLSSLVMLTVSLSRQTVTELDDQMRHENRSLHHLFKPAVITIILLFINVLIGAFFKHSRASKVLLDLGPAEVLFESPFFAELLYVVHGSLTTLIIIGTLWMLFHSFRVQSQIKPIMFFVLLIVLNGVSGIVVYIYSLNPLQSSFHMILTSLTLAVGVFITAKSWLGKYVVLNR